MNANRNPQRAARRRPEPTAARRLANRGVVLGLALCGALSLSAALNAAARADDRVELHLSDPGNVKAGLSTRPAPQRSSSRQLQLATGETVRLEGTLRYDLRKGFTLDGTQIELPPRVSFGLASADGNDRLPDAQSLDGKIVTLFGRRTDRGVRATLVIAHDVTELSTMTPSTPVDGVPSSEDSRVGELKDGAPK